MNQILSMLKRVGEAVRSHLVINDYASNEEIESMRFSHLKFLHYREAGSIEGRLGVFH